VAILTKVRFDPHKERTRHGPEEILETQNPSPGELVALPKGWSYGDPQKPNERVRLHESGSGQVVTEAVMDETVDGVLLHAALKSALPGAP
jgi:hypothetical protein